MNNPVENGNTSLTLSIILGVFSWFDIDSIIKLITAVGAIASAFFASRYYIAAKKKENAERRLAEEELRKLKENE